MLIRAAQVHGHGKADVRIEGGLIAGIGNLAPRAEETVIEAGGGALLPGLHDHHIHLASLAVREQSVICGPPEVTTRDALADRIGNGGSGWLRGILYHESVMGLPGAAELDAICPHRPLRIQHRSGRMWLLNTPALDQLLAQSLPPPGLERDGSGFTGRLFDEDQWLQAALGSDPPDFAGVSRMLARRGVTGITDMSPRNDAAMAGHFAAQIRSGALAQRVVLAGELSLADAVPDGWTMGPAKLHLHEAALPSFDNAVTFASRAHDRGRAVAIHCVSEVELVFAIAVIEATGAQRGDRIEHASIASPDLVARIAQLGLIVCVQPHFLTERGEQYRRDVEPRLLPDLYRLRSFANAGVTLCAGSDAPFGSADPWAAIAAAVDRRTPTGTVMTPDEALAPDAALALYLRDPADPTRQLRIGIGAPADVCLLAHPWDSPRPRHEEVRLTMVSGRIIHDSIDQTPL